MKKKSKIKKLSNSDILAGNRFISKFVGLKWYTESWRSGLYRQLYKCESVNEIKFPVKISDTDIMKAEFHSNWQWLMFVVDKIEAIGAHIDIKSHGCELVWWYSPKKTGTFEKVFGGGGGHTEKRYYFDSIFGKYYNYYAGVGETANKVNADTKILSVYITCLYFIKWYNKNVSKEIKKEINENIRPNK